MKRAAMLVLGCTLAACTGEDADLGLDEPLRVPLGTFKPGELPGEPPLPPDAPPETPVTDPRVTLIESVNNVLSPGQANKTLAGRATESAVAIGVRFADLGTGYWVVPAGSPEPSVPGERVWSLGLEVDREVPHGLHTLRLAAIGESGEAGTQSDLLVCVTRPIPDNLNACDPTIEPPAAVLSLEWDNAADLDLGVFFPSGKLVDAKHPTSATGEELDPDPAADGVILTDGNAACGDLSRRESLVFQGPPPDGGYAVYVNLFEACGAQATRFVVTLHLREPREDGTFDLVEVLRVPGELLALQANGGATAGLYVTSFSFQ